MERVGFIGEAEDGLLDVLGELEILSIMKEEVLQM